MSGAWAEKRDCRSSSVPCSGRCLSACARSWQSRGFVTYAGLFSRLAAQLADRKHLPFDFAVVDEAQDVSVAQLRFLAALGADQPNSLFFAGDLGQRIFQPPFSWKALGVDIRGRSRTLHINYRTSHQIRMQADRLLGPELSDVDGNTEQRVGTISVFNGPTPTIRVLRKSRRRKPHGRDMACGPRQRRRDASRNGRVRPFACGTRPGSCSRRAGRAAVQGARRARCKRAARPHDRLGPQESSSNSPIRGATSPMDSIALSFRSRSATLRLSRRKPTTPTCTPCRRSRCTGSVWRIRATAAAGSSGLLRPVPSKSKRRQDRFRSGRLG